MAVTGLFSCRKELLRRMGECTKGFPRARASIIMGLLKEHLVRVGMTVLFFETAPSLRAGCSLSSSSLHTKKGAFS